MHFHCRSDQFRNRTLGLIANSNGRFRISKYTREILQKRYMIDCHSDLDRVVTFLVRLSRVKLLLNMSKLISKGK